MVLVIDAGMSMEHWWNDIDMRDEVLGEESVSVLLCPQQISHTFAGI
jgi:hypothetical protein